MIVDFRLKVSTKYDKKLQFEITQEAHLLKGGKIDLANKQQKAFKENLIK